MMSASFQRKIKPLLSLLSILLFLIFILVPLMVKSAGLELIHDEYRSHFSNARWIGLPLAFLFSATIFIRPADSRSRKEIKFLLTFLAAVFCFAVLGIGRLFISCGWTDENLPYKNIKDPGTNIVMRSYGCGAWDSGEPDRSIVQVKKWSRFFIKVSPVDTSTLNRTEWVQTKSSVF